MKSLIFFWALGIALLTAVGPVRAEEQAPTAAPGKRLAALKAQLELTDEQANQLGEVFAARRGRCAAEPEGNARRECRQRNFAEGKKQLESILNPDQLAKFQSLRAARRANRLEHREHGRCPEERDSDTSL
ncbi:MAG: hypothetical protein U0136_19765 [Bdellovibrionota bacterium]